MVYKTAILPADFILRDDGLFYAVIPATTHKLGTEVYVDKVDEKTGDHLMENTLPTYEISIYGDITFFVEEPKQLRVVLSNGR